MEDSRANMEKQDNITKIYCNKEYSVGKIDPRVFGSFLEHMGRVIYSGIYEPGHNNADKNGYRLDVLNAAKKMGVTTLRYPGGNFVSAYNWEDGVGPIEDRPRRLELAWRAIETNEFGTNEFMSYISELGASPILTVNLGTRGIEDAVHYLEYCNFPGGTKYSELRKKHGIENPYNVKMWCLGNEMDGKWQIGHKSAEDYGKLAAETGKVMKLVDPSIELIVCGSSLSTMDTYPMWDMEVLEHTYDVADYLALHQYYGNQEKGTEYFLAQSLDMEEYIKTIKAVVQVIKHKKRSDKDIKLSVDEWGVWAKPCDSVNQDIDEQVWQVAPAISEQIYTMEDALLFALMQMTILRNVDAIKIACQSLLTNISACIMTERDGEMWLQTIFYPYFYYANYAKGTVLDVNSEGPSYNCEGFSNVPNIETLVVNNDEDEELVIFAVNRSADDRQNLEIDVSDFSIVKIIESIQITSSDIKMTNREVHDMVHPEKLNDVKVEEGVCKAVVEPLSFNMIRLKM